jgi:hypothetical protein
MDQRRIAPKPTTNGERKQAMKECLHSAARNYFNFCPTCVEEKKQAEELRRYQGELMSRTTSFTCEHGTYLLCNKRCDCAAEAMLRQSQPTEKVNK